MQSSGGQHEQRNQLGNQKERVRVIDNMRLAMLLQGPPPAVVSLSPSLLPSLRPDRLKWHKSRILVEVW